MPLSTGDKLGPYEIVAPIGAGGMGEVYRARDTKLKREVAIKVLPETFARDPERMARFQREAEVLASLNHPNIAAIYGVEDRALVMELVEGESPQGPLPFDEAWHICSQIAAALEYAHERGIMHRDLKPANVKVTPEGVVKLLDFGLAKAFTNQRDPSASPENSPTLTLGATEVGVILGTAAYMAPEQARGKQVDKRADIWSFGVVLYELLTGERLFSGEDAAETLASVIHKQPDFSKAPREARRLLEECLQKDPKQRLRDIGDAKRLLVGAGTESVGPERARRVAVLPGIIAAVVFAVVAFALGFIYFREAREEKQLMKLSVLPPDHTKFKATSLIAMSPDGRHLAFVATKDGKDELWVRDMDSLIARSLPGTDGANDPFWSPDSRFIAFFADAKLKKIDLAGGSALTLCDAGTIDGGGTWNMDGTIVFTPDTLGGLFRVAAEGGTVSPLAKPGGQLETYPSFLPDGRHFIYTELGKHKVYAGELGTQSRRELITETSNARYIPPGYLLFLREGTLMVQPFDPDRLEIRGGPIPVVEQVDYGVNSSRGQFSVSETGAIAYVSGDQLQNQLTWFDRTGKSLGTLGISGQVQQPRISPDGKLVAADRGDAKTNSWDIWLHDIVRGTARRLTFTSKQSRSRFPVWSPDGSRLAFFSTKEGPARLYQRSLANDAHEEVVDEAARPVDWSRDGRSIVEEVMDQETNSYNIRVLPLFGDRKSYPYLETPFNERRATLSPNGLWLAYESDETRRNEIYVQTFPKPTGKWQISTGGGQSAIWSKDGKELYFVSADGKMMAIEVKLSPQFEPGLPKPLFDVQLLGEWFDVSTDGRFLIPTHLDSSNPPITVVLNWQAGLKK